MQFFDDFFTPASFPSAYSSETTLIHDIFIPDDAKVIPKIYVTIIN